MVLGLVVVLVCPFGLRVFGLSRHGSFFLFLDKLITENQFAFIILLSFFAHIICVLICFPFSFSSSSLAGRCFVGYDNADKVLRLAWLSRGTYVRG